MYTFLQGTNPVRKTQIGLENTHKKHAGGVLKKPTDPRMGTILVGLPFELVGSLFSQANHTRSSQLNK